MKILKITSLLVLITFFTMITVNSCDSILPSSFRDGNNNLKLTAEDELACQMLSGEISKTDTLINGSDTTFVTQDFFTQVSTVYINKTFVSSWMDSSISVISALFDTLTIGTKLYIQNIESRDSTYILLDNLQKTITIYLAWNDLTESNIDDYAKIEILEADGSIVPLIENKLSLDLIAGCTDFYERAGVVEAAPKIRGKFVFELPEGIYLTRIYLSDPVLIKNFRMVIL